MGRGWRRRLCRRVVGGKVQKGWYRHWTHLRREGSKGSEGSEGSKGGGIALWAMSFIIPLRGMENRTTGLTPEGNAPLFPCGDFPRRGKFALLPASELISTSIHSTAKSSPSGVAKELDSQGADRRLRIQ